MINALKSIRLPLTLLRRMLWLEPAGPQVKLIDTSRLARSRPGVGLFSLFTRDKRIKRDNYFELLRPGRVRVAPEPRLMFSKSMDRAFYKLTHWLTGGQIVIIARR